MNVYNDYACVSGFKHVQVESKLGAILVEEENEKKTHLIPP
jgi:hypothetical protein